MTKPKAKPTRKRKRITWDTAETAKHAERQKKALEMSVRGIGYDAIALELGYANRSGAYKAVQAALMEITRAPAEEVRTHELERMDRLYNIAAGLAERVEFAEIERVDGCTMYVVADGAKVQLDAIRTATKLLERRAKLLGLDAPTKVDAKLVDTSAMNPEEARKLLLDALEFAKKKAGLK